LFLSETGEVYACGSGRYGQLGTGDEEDRLTPVKISFPVGTNPIKEISAGRTHSMFLDEVGKVYTCGHSEDGNMGTGTREAKLTPVEIKFPSSDPVKVEFPPSDVPIKAEFKSSIIPIKVEFPATAVSVKIEFAFGADPIKKIISGYSATFFLTVNGNVFSCGIGENGILGTGTKDDHLSPVKINFPPNTDGPRQGLPVGPIEKISFNHYHAVFLTEAGEIYYCGVETHRRRPGTGVLFFNYLRPKYSRSLKMSRHRNGSYLEV
jgi:alpha-tubulin suppressor-like RCC1 family protein